MAQEKVKFMCSSAGKILPRPSDMSLRYVGGETRMISLPRYIQYQDFYVKMVELYGPDITIKYQLPQEDLDSLVSVSSVEDLENMFEECDRLRASEGSSKLRVFVFLPSELNSHGIDDTMNFKNSEQKFVDAINSVSGDAAPMHSAMKSYMKSYSFNNAQRPWNYNQSRDQRLLFSNNPYADAFFSKDCVSHEDSYWHGSFVPAQLQNSTSPFSHAAYMAQLDDPSTSAPVAAPNNNLENARWNDFHSLFRQGPDCSFLDTKWVNTSEVHVQKYSPRREDKMYITGDLSGEWGKIKTRGVQFAQESFTDDRDIEHLHPTGESFGEHNRRQTGGVQFAQESFSNDRYIDHLQPTGELFGDHNRRQTGGVQFAQESFSNDRDIEHLHPTGESFGEHNRRQTGGVQFAQESFSNDRYIEHLQPTGELFGEHNRRQTGGVQFAQESFSNDRDIEHLQPTGESLFGEHNRRQTGGVQFAEAFSTHIRKAEKVSKIGHSPAAEHRMPVLQESPLSQMESPDIVKESVCQSHSDHLVLSPGAFWQKQLMSSSSSDKLSFPTFPISGTFESQQEACMENLEEDWWERFPPSESPFGLNEDHQVFTSMWQPAATEVPPFSRESSAAIFPANSVPSMQRWKLESEKDSESKEDPLKIYMGNFFPMNNGPLASPSARISTTFAPFPRGSAQEVEPNAENISDKPVAQNSSSADPNIDTDELCHISSSHRIEPLNVFSDPVSLVSSKPDTSQLFVNQSGGERDRFQSSVKGQHSRGFSLSEVEFLPNHHGIDALQGQRSKYLDRFSNVSKASSLDDTHNTDFLSDLLGSCRLNESLAAPSSTAESLRSRSVGSLDKEPWMPEDDNSIASTGKECLFVAGEGLDFPFSTQRNSEFLSLETKRNSLPSNEQFDRVLMSSFSSDYDNKSNSFVESSFTTKKEGSGFSAPQATQLPAFTSLIETWEATLQHAAEEQVNESQEAVMYEQDQEQDDGNPKFDEEIGLEESGVESEEEGSTSFKYGPNNAAARAEQEAVARGLQIIRNCDLEELTELGSGTFGTVYHGKWRGTDVAIKRIKASCFNGRQPERDRLVADFWREAYILGQLHHPNVVAFYGVVPDGPGGTLATVTEYMVNGSLKQVLQNKDRTLDRRKKLLIAMDAAFGMEYLHEKNVVHFDIKCENLLVNLKDTQRPVCKVADLGLSKVKQNTFVSGGVRGTLPWMAPELLNGNSNFVSEKVDVFSFGIVMWELLTGEEPYANMHHGAIIGILHIILAKFFLESRGLQSFKCSLGLTSSSLSVSLCSYIYRATDFICFYMHW
ncbi:hypothetical protein KP509_12G034700 [Ceratopteris richardii]|uniref:Protein kinase domain-containing protein n=1 Tax=Ceratopteris richardii TaxID=49495 RepID=A0A8T2TI42_CERRI|nr:hypothetical protein KP509_12G034700 [Ceratopteris richardii]